MNVPVVSRKQKMKQENPQNNLVILQGTMKEHKIWLFSLLGDKFT